MRLVVDEGTCAGILRVLGRIGFVALVGGSLLVGSARWFWLGEVAVALTWHLGIVSVVGALLLACVGLRCVALGALVLGAVHLGPELWLWVPVPCEGRAPARVFTLVSCNRLVGAPNWESLPAQLARLDAELASDRGTAGAPAIDAIAFQEADRAFLAALDSMRGTYPYQAFAPPRERWNGRTFGTVIVSRWPFVSARELPPPPGRVRGAQDVVLDWAGTPVAVRNVHPMRPGKAWRVTLRNGVLEQLAGLDWDGPALLAGDLNMTSQSPAFRDLLDATGLVDSRRGFGRQPTFVLEQSRGLGLSVPIDHVLATSAWCIQSRRTFAVPESDHDGVVVEAALRE